MIRIADRLKKEKLAAHMILQVHDELLFEVPEQELQTDSRPCQRRNGKGRKLDVPLQVDIGVGKNWSEAH